MSTKELNSNHWEELQNIALKLAEGVVSQSLSTQPSQNVFGRRVQQSTEGDIGFNLGLAATGLRTVAFLRSNEIDDAVALIKQAVDQQLATVLVLQYSSISQITQFSTTGAFILSASTWQEAADLLCIAQHTSESTLIPGVIAIPDKINNNVDAIELDFQKVKNYLGNPDEWVTAPTPSQKLIFGEKRKRIPNWFDPDLPVAMGAVKNDTDTLYQKAAHHHFFQNHLTELLEKAYSEYSAIFGRKYTSLVSSAKKANYSLIATGVEEHLLNTACEKSDKHSSVNYLLIRLLCPLPEEELKQQTAKSEGITVLDQSSDRGFTKLIKSTLYGHNAPLYSAAHSGKLEKESIEMGLRPMFAKGDKEFFLDVLISKSKSLFPKHEILLNHINREYPSLVDKNVITKKAPSANVADQKSVTRKIRQFKDGGPAYSKVARFYDDTALLYETDEMMADPFQAIAVIPSDTASFKNIQQPLIPKFEQNNCTGCGDCFMVCPHSALPPLAITVRNLIEGGMAIAKRNGNVLKSFIPLSKAIAGASNEIINSSDGKVKYVEDFLSEAAHKVFKQKAVVEDKLALAETELKTLLSLIGSMPIAVTDTFFKAQNIQDTNEGELFTLGIDTSACVGCGICAASCEEEALEMIDRTPEILADYQDRFALFEDLPDTDGYILERQIVDENYDSLAAVLLSKPFYQSINGATLEHEPAKKVMLHLAAAMTELAIQPKVKKTTNEIDDVLAKLEAYVHKNLDEALPAKDYDTLNEALKASNGQRIPFEEMVANWSSKEHLKLIDVADLQLRINLIHDLKDLKWALNEGPTGIGRARYSLLIDASLKEMVPYPWSSFTTPVLVNSSGSSFAMFEGLIQGCIRHTIDNIKIIRRAQLVAQKKYNPSVHDRELAVLDWESLTSSERTLVMPILLVVSKENAESNKKLLKLLNQPWPIKIMVLDDAVNNIDSGAADLANSQTQLMPLIAQQKAIILKSSLADKEHLYHGLYAGLNSENASLFWLLAPRANAHHTPWQKWPKLNALAFNTRAFTHLYFNPFKKKNMLSSAIEIENNPLSKRDWKEIDLAYEEKGEQKIIDYKLTWADWAYTQYNWRNEFNEITTDAQSLPLSDYLQLSAIKRGANIPVIYRLSNENGLQMFAVSQKVVETTQAVLTSWNVLQEFAGVKTQFPDKLRKEMEVEFTSLKNLEIEKVEKIHEAKIKKLEEEFLNRTSEKITENLMNLSKLSKN